MIDTRHASPEELLEEALKFAELLRTFVPLWVDHAHDLSGKIDDLRRRAGLEVLPRAAGLKPLPPTTGYRRAP